MKILIISGFLGAGKTSFIKSLSKGTKREFVIVENEFGESSIDGQALRLDNRDQGLENKVWELSEGCICCSLNLDFSQSVLTIANTLDPDYLIVEPSGVAKPSAIIEQLRKISYERISLLAPITIIDRWHYQSSRLDFPDYFNDQLAAAGTVLLSKSENLTAEDFSRIKQELSIRPDVFFPEKHYQSFSEGEWRQLLLRELSTQEGKRFVIQQPLTAQEDGLEEVTLRNLSVTSADELYYRLEQATLGRYGRLLRAKGFVRINKSEESLHFELVEGRFEITGAKFIEQSQAVFIGRNLRRTLIKTDFCLRQSLAGLIKTRSKR